MYAYNWEYEFDPFCPVHIFPFSVIGNRDKLHWHQYFEIGLCIKGNGKFIYLNKEYEVKEGDVFLANNFENHVAITDNGETTNYIFLIFLPSFIADPNGRLIDLEYLALFKYNPMNFENKIDSKEPTSKKLRKFITEVLALYEAKDEFYQLEIDIKLRQILLELNRYFKEKGTLLPMGEGSFDIKIQQAIKYMNLHFNDNLTIAQVADIIDMNPSYFRHLFKECTQLTFKTYITYLRLSQAKKLLLATDKSINDIIIEVGYNNMNQFYKVFNKFVFMSPSEYRKQYKDGSMKP